MNLKLTITTATILAIDLGKFKQRLLRIERGNQGDYSPHDRDFADKVS